MLFAWNARALNRGNLIPAAATRRSIPGPMSAWPIRAPVVTASAAALIDRDQRENPSICP